MLFSRSDETETGRDMNMKVLKEQFTTSDVSMQLVCGLRLSDRRVPDALYSATQTGDT